MAVSVQTQRIVFGGSLGCAYPGCEVRAVTVSRGVSTLSCQCAHIRSAKPGGPRYDPTYADPDGPLNLLLLCGTHHPMVDNHEATFTTEELDVWREKALVSKTPDLFTASDLAALMTITRASSRLISGKKRAEMSSDLATITGELAILAQLRPGGIRAAEAVTSAAAASFARPGTGTTPQVLESAVAELWAELRQG